jgi:hypothetical protein
MGLHTRVPNTKRECTLTKTAQAHNGFNVAAKRKGKINVGNLGVSIIDRHSIYIVY